MGDYSVVSYSIIEYHDSELKDLEIITDFPTVFLKNWNLIFVEYRNQTDIKIT